MSTNLGLNVLSRGTLVPKDLIGTDFEVPARIWPKMKINSFSVEESSSFINIFFFSNHFKNTI